MPLDYHQVIADDRLLEDARTLIRLAIREDLDCGYDWTTALLAPPAACGEAAVAVREDGVVAGLEVGRLTLAEFDPALVWTPQAVDGQFLARGETLARISGPTRSLLTAERTLLNILGRLSGVATLTRKFVDAVAGSGARIYDTRKTMPGWRRLEKLAVRAGGGHNHRLGLFDGILIKDNHLAVGAGAGRYSPAEAVLKARQFVAAAPPGDPRRELLIEVEVDTLAQLEEVLPASPDIVLLDNMPPPLLKQAVERRNAAFPQVELEASGRVRLDTVAGIARTGVERISAGAITHSAVWLDVGLDWTAAS